MLAVSEQCHLPLQRVPKPKLISQDKVEKRRLYSKIFLLFDYTAFLFFIRVFSLLFFSCNTFDSVLDLFVLFDGCTFSGVKSFVAIYTT